MPKTSGPKDLDWGMLPCWRNHSENTPIKPPTHHTAAVSVETTPLPSLWIMRYIKKKSFISSHLNSVMMKTGFSVLMVIQYRIKLFCYVKMDFDSLFRKNHFIVKDREQNNRDKAQVLFVMIVLTRCLNVNLPLLLLVHLLLKWITVKSYLHS